MKLKTLFVAALVSCGIVSCFSPVAPPPLPSLNSAGKAIVQQSVFLLKTLRLMHDLRSANTVFDVNSAVADTLSLSPVFWNELGATAILQRGLAKQKSTSVSLFSQAAGALSQSAAQADSLIFAYDTGAYDTVFQLASDTNQWVGVRPLAASLLDTVFTMGYDSIYWQLSGLDTIRAKIIRLRVNAAGTYTDLQRWDSLSANWVLVRRQQQQLNSGRIFSHTAIIVGGVIYDSISTVETAPSVQRIFYIERSDNSAQWWQSLSNSILLSYRDSTIYADSTVFRALSDTDGVMLNTGLDEDQHLFVRVTRLSDQNKIRFETHETLRYNPVQQTSLIKSFSTVEIKSSGDTITSILSALDSLFVTADTCSLTVTIKLSPLNYDSTRFGLRTKSTYSAWLIHSSDWDSVRYLSLYRKDLLVSAAALSYVEWIQEPKVPAVWGNFSGIPSTIIARSVNPIGDSTRFMQWSRSDTGSTVTNVRLWVGNSGDTLRINSSVNSASIVYHADSVNNEVRRGVITIGVSGNAIADTLLTFAGDRLTQGLFSSDTSGVFTITGAEQYQLRLAGDSLIVSGVPGEYPLPVTTMSWVDSSGVYLANYTDGIRNLRVSSRITIDNAGTMRGSWDAFNNDDAAIFQGRSIFVSPRKSGSATIYGLATSAGTILEPNCIINLWQINNLGGEYTFY